MKEISAYDKEVGYFLNLEKAWNLALQEGRTEHLKSFEYMMDLSLARLERMEKDK